MELRHLRILATVVQAGGFSAASRVLGSTQSTISKAIQQLEHDCGMPLLERLPRGVRPTSAGEIVLRRAAAMLAGEENLQAELDALRGLETGRLRLGVPPLGSSVLFAPLIAEYRRRHPGIQIDLHEEGSHTLEHAVLTGEIEIGASLLPAADSLSSHPVCNEPMLALLPAGHPLAGKARLSLRQLDGDKIILFERGFALNSVIEAACAKRKITFVEAARSGQPDFILALVAAGLGLSLLPRIMITSPQAGVVAIPVEDADLRWKLGLIWRRGAVLSPAAQRWLELVRTAYPPAEARRRTQI
ncbi:MAG: LysR substrate-binding domain-containing protein [Chthoniobacteraceae bacterium]